MKKTLNAVRTVVTWILVVAAVAMMVFTIVSVTTLDRTDRKLFGCRAFIVLSDSMSATDFSAGDVIFTREVDPAELRPGDIISYLSQNPENFGEVVTHKIRSLTTTDTGDPAFITYGTTTDTDDALPVTYALILGRYTFRLPRVGAFFQFLKTTPGYVCCILIPFLLLIALQGLNCVCLFKRYRGEQMAQLEQERAQLEQERVQSQQMMAELLELKRQLADRQPAGPDAPEEGARQPEEESAGVK